MKKLMSSVLVLCLVMAILTGCGKSSLSDLQADLALYNTTQSAFSLNTNLNILYDRNANLMAGNWDADSEQYDAAKKEVTKTADDSIKVIKNMNLQTPQGKALKNAYLALYELERDLLDQNLRHVKSGNASDKQKAMETNMKVADAKKGPP